MSELKDNEKNSILSENEFNEIQETNTERVNQSKESTTELRSETTENVCKSNKKKIMRPSQYKENMDVKGFTIKKVYFANDDLGYLIIKTVDNEIRVFGGKPTKVEYLLAECKYLTASLILRDSSREMFDYQRAIAINCYLLGEIETSRKILKSLKNKLHNRKLLTKKLWYIGVFLLVTLFMIILSIYRKNFFYIKYIKIATFGAIGGFISLNLKLQKIKFKISESTISYILVSIYKVVFSMLTSVISFFLIESELVLGIVKNSNINNSYFIYAIATLAGFSESLLPNIFKSIENKTAERSNKEDEEEKEDNEDII